jgi:hypothetical protein
MLALLHLRRYFSVNRQAIDCFRGSLLCRRNNLLPFLAAALGLWNMVHSPISFSHFPYVLLASDIDLKIYPAVNRNKRIL